ncbi:hypothetical protein WISP_142299 [Willisornis vidua]|uniref:Uncharacterized protein n=1 Tax=Willisornis vidua TaxID=1566151 RepID=A0ABQ9CLM9_9PASS|nr:hypothetical protein WISP_142299 [Willisornis vidua]
MTETAMQTTKISEDGWRGGRDSTAAHLEDHGEAAVPLQPMEVHSGAEIYLQPLKYPTTKQVDVPKGGCDPLESPCRITFLARTCRPVEFTLKLTLEQF